MLLLGRMPKYSEYLEEDPASRFLERLDLLRKAHGWSEARLARKIEVPRQTLQRWFARPSRIAVRRAEAVENILRAHSLGAALEEGQVESWLVKQLNRAPGVREEEQDVYYYGVAGHSAVRLAQLVRSAGITVDYEILQTPQYDGAQVALRDAAGNVAAQVAFVPGVCGLFYKAFQRAGAKFELLFEGTVDGYAFSFCREFLVKSADQVVRKRDNVENKISKKIDDYYKQQRIGSGFRFASP